MLLTIEFWAAPAHIDIINLEALPITYSVCCVFVEVADNSTTHNTLLFCTQRKALFVMPQNGYNVPSAKKDTKRSSNILLCLVSFFTERTLHHFSVLIWLATEHI